MKKPAPSLRAQACFDLLARLMATRLPMVYSSPEDIHKILSLRSADMVQALIEPPTLQRNGQRLIPRAIVVAVTAQGRAVVMPARPTRQRG